ncbi:MAG: CcdB family protein [Candidatus Methylumidiphilus sp.]
MAQFDVYPNPESRQDKIPFLLDVQCELLSELNTRVVVPLYDMESAGRPPLRGLTPVFTLAGRKVIMMTPELAGVPTKRLPPKIANLAAECDLIIAALDFVFTGA